MVALWLALPAVVLAAEAGPRLLDRAEAEVAALKYTRAAVTLSELEQARGLDRRQAVRALALSARVKAALGQADAREAFVRLFEIEPGYALEGRAAPKITGPFFEAKALARPLVLKVDADARGRQWVNLKLTLEGPVTRLKKVRVRVTEDGIVREQSLAPAPEHNLRVNAKELKVAVSAEDERAWVLCEVAQTFEELPEPVALEPKPSPAPAAQLLPSQQPPAPVVLVTAPVRQTRFRPLAYTLLALGLGAAGTGIGLYTKAAISSAELQRARGMESEGMLPITYERAAALNGEVRDFGWAAAAVGGAGAAMLLTAMIVYLVGTP